MASIFFKGTGSVLAAERDSSGNPGPFLHLGLNDNGAKFALTTETGTVKNTDNTQLLDALRYEKSKSASLEFNLHLLAPKTIAMGLRGLAADIAAGSVTGEALPAGLAVDDYVRLAKPNVSSVVVVDSTGTPKTLTPNVNYSVFSAKHGTLKMLDLTTGGPFVEPYEADYSNGVASNIPMFTQEGKAYFLRFELEDSTPDSVGKQGRHVLVEFYNVPLDAIAEFAMKSDDPAIFPFKGAPLYDETKASDPVLGQYGRVVLI